MFGLGNNEEAKLYYLYMMADGEVAHSEMKLFDEICKGLNISEDDKHIIINDCNEMVSTSKTPFEIIKGEKLDDQVGHGWFGLKDNSSLARIIWNLVNLGYADTYYSDEEKQIVKHLLSKWNFNQEVYQEMVDTADTMLALMKQKEWIKLTFQNGDKRNEKEKKIDSEIKIMLSDIKLTIDELTM